MVLDKDQWINYWVCFHQLRHQKSPPQKKKTTLLLKSRSGEIISSDLKINNVQEDEQFCQSACSY